MIDHIAAQLGIPAEKIDIQAPFVDYGLDSVQAVSIAGEIEGQLGRSLPPTLLWDYPTIAALAAHLTETPLGAVIVPEPAREAPLQHVPIAVIGLSCRFPGADGPEAFWQLLQEGVDAVQEVPAERWDLGRFYGEGDDLQPGMMSTRWGGFLEQVDGSQ
jgi:polyketide synthase 12/myxalamid-type polyketide synthase MxaF